MSSGLHSVVQHANDFDDARLHHATHRGEEERRISGAGIAPMPFFARPQNRTDIAPGDFVSR
jgi:hypothetical protein